MGSKKFCFKKVGNQNFGPKNFGSKNILGPNKTFGLKSFGPLNVFLILTNFVCIISSCISNIKGGVEWGWVDGYK